MHVTDSQQWSTKLMEMHGCFMAIKFQFGFVLLPVENDVMRPTMVMIPGSYVKLH